MGRLAICSVEQKQHCFSLPVLLVVPPTRSPVFVCCVLQLFCHTCEHTLGLFPEPFPTHDLKNWMPSIIKHSTLQKPAGHLCLGCATCSVFLRWPLAPALSLLVQQGFSLPLGAVFLGVMVRPRKFSCWSAGDS